MKKIQQGRLFRVYAHLYHSHFKIICALQAEKHLNTIFKHFVYFAVEFSLISSEEMMPLRELVGRRVASARICFEERDFVQQSCVTTFIILFVKTTRIFLSICTPPLSAIVVALRDCSFP